MKWHILSLASLVLLASCATTSLRDVPEFQATTIKAYDLSRIPSHRVKVDILDHRPDEMLSNTDALRKTLQLQVSLILEKSAIETSGTGPSVLIVTVSPYYDDNKVFQDHCVELEAKLHMVPEGETSSDSKPVGARHRPVDVHVWVPSCFDYETKFGQFSKDISKAYALAFDKLFETLQSELRKLPTGSLIN